MALPSLAAALAQVRGDTTAAAALANTAAAAVRPHGGDGFSFIKVVDQPAPKRSGPLLGCIYSVKDNIDVNGMVTTCGSRVFKHRPPSTRDAWIVQALDNAGAQCIGKNNMHEFALGGSGANAEFGTTTNPWDRGRNCGGSSGGSALAVAERQVHVSLGTDSGGSVRMPASFTGIVGFKPTPDKLSMAGVDGAAYSMDCLGFFTATVGDLATVWDAVVPSAVTVSSTQRPRLAYLQDDSMGRVDPSVWDAYQHAIEKLRAAGYELTGVSIPGLQICPYVCISVVYPEIASAHFHLLREQPELYDQEIRGLICLGELWSSRNYLDAQRIRSLLRLRFQAILDPFDAVLMPAVAIQPPKLGETPQVAGDPPGAGLYTLMRFTVPFNVIGYPAISVPAGFDRDRLPFGLQAVGRPGADAALLGVARHIEDVMGVMPAPGAT
jgi:aspartyl-tRNA(Asn)/glutamyl-tRNA(Gln) amidotransferase subunit A